MVILKQDRIEYTNTVMDRNIFACVGYFISFFLSSNSLDLWVC